MWRTCVVAVASVLVTFQLPVGAEYRRQPTPESTGPNVPVSFIQELPVVVVDSPLKILTGHKSLIYSLSFSPNGKTLASGSEDSDGAPIKLWDVATGELKVRLPEKTSFVLAVQFHHDGIKLASTSGFDAVVRLWDIGKQGEPVTLEAPFGEEGASATLTNPDGVKTYRGQIKGVSFHPQGKLVATAGPGQLVRVWDIEAKKLLATLPAHPATVTAVAFSPDGKTLATASASGNSLEEPGTLKLWETATWQETGKFPGIKAAVDSISFHPKGNMIVSNEFKGKMRLLDVARKQELATIPCQSEGLRPVAFSPDGKTIAFVGSDGNAQLVAAENPNEIRAFKSDSNRVFAVAFSPDGKILATAGADSKIRLWKLQD